MARYLISRKSRECCRRVECGNLLAVRAEVCFWLLEEHCYCGRLLYQCFSCTVFWYWVALPLCQLVAFSSCTVAFATGVSVHTVDHKLLFKLLAVNALVERAAWRVYCVLWL